MALNELDADYSSCMKINVMFPASLHEFFFKSSMLYEFILITITIPPDSKIGRIPLAISPCDGTMRTMGQWRIQRGGQGAMPPPKRLMKKILVCKIVDCNVGLNLQSCMTCTILGVVPSTEILCNGNEGRSKGGSKSM